MQGNTGKLSAWLQLIRLPNLLTVPGDPLAGYFLAVICCGSGFSLAAIYAMLASLLLYTFGLISNDLFDLNEDMRDRPGRPLPSGRIKPMEAATVAAILVLVALMVASLNGCLSVGISAVLAVTIIIYNSFGKKIPVLGPLNMGLCRGLSMLLGASITGVSGLASGNVIVAATLLTVYIAAVTCIAAKETVRQNLGSKRWWPVFSIVLFLAPLFWNGSFVAQAFETKVFSGLMFTFVLLWTWKAGALLAGTPAPGVVPAAVGRFIQGLLIVQALLLSFCSWHAQIAAGVLVMVFPFFSILARRFYSS